MFTWWTPPLLDTFALGLYDIVEKETIPSMTDLRGVQITTNAGTLEMEYQEDSGRHTVTSIPVLED